MAFPPARLLLRLHRVCNPFTTTCRHHGYGRLHKDLKRILVAYDTPLIVAVEKRWHGLLDNEHYAGDLKGKVDVVCRLHQDGSITDVISKSTGIDSAHALLCESAIKDPAPFSPWSVEMRRMIKSNHRKLTLTFVYD